MSLAGRFLVMVPGEPETYGISKRLPDDERSPAPADPRRAASGRRRPHRPHRRRGRDAARSSSATCARLRSQWDQISALAAKSKSAKLLYQEPDLVLRLIREEFTKEYRGIVIDDRALYEETKGYVEAIAPELADRVEFYDTEEEGLPIFERFHIYEQLMKALDRKVWLPSGGSLVIERTEALTVIDVNTGKNVGRTNLEETVYRNNLEAAEEVARQLRLRDIGGIIVIDFIDMEIRANREDVMRVFRDALGRDKTRTQAFEMSELGLVEMTRKRISEGLVESFSETCPTCHGRGLPARRVAPEVDRLGFSVSSGTIRGISRAMYAVIKTGGKQYRVEQGEQLEVELVGADDGAELELTPVLLVDGDTVLATRNQLEHAVVKAKVVGATRGPKIDGFIYKPKSNNRRRYGHRQDLSVLEITAITPGRARVAQRGEGRRRAESRAETGEPETVEED